jgi:hypothetical protein
MITLVSLALVSAALLAIVVGGVMRVKAAIAAGCAILTYVAAYMGWGVLSYYILSTTQWLVKYWNLATYLLPPLLPAILVYRAVGRRVSSPRP